MNIEPTRDEIDPCGYTERAGNTGIRTRGPDQSIPETGNQLFTLVPCSLFWMHMQLVTCLFHPIPSCLPILQFVRHPPTILGIIVSVTLIV